MIYYTFKFKFYGSLDTCQPLGVHLPGEGRKRKKKVVAANKFIRSMLLGKLLSCYFNSGKFRKNTPKAFIFKRFTFRILYRKKLVALKNSV